MLQVKQQLLKASIINIILTQQIGYGFYDSDGDNKPLFDYYSLLFKYTRYLFSRDSLFQAEARRCKNILDTVIEKHK